MQSLNSFIHMFQMYDLRYNISEKVTAPHCSTLAWKIPWVEEPGRLQSMRSLRVWHDWATSFHFSLSCIGEGNGNPLQCSCLENPRDGGAWWAAVYGVAQSRTRLKRVSSSSSSSSKQVLWALGETATTGPQIGIFRSPFYDPNSCISLLLEKY